MKNIAIRNNIIIGDNNPLVLIAGPCVVEDEKTTISIAENIKKISEDLQIPFIFKASYEKDNRSSIDGYRGPGIKKGLKILKNIKTKLDLPVISDVHRETDVDMAAEVLDIIQIPAYLCQQTSLLIKAGKSNKVINIKKGQFLAPENINGPVSKVLSTGNEKILITERGTCFGYNRLVSDICSIPIMQNSGFPVVFDATHIVRIYGIPSKDKEGGNPGFIGHLARAGVAAGADALFLEVHPDPRNAKCDAASVLQLELLPDLLKLTMAINEVVKNY